MPISARYYNLLKKSSVSCLRLRALAAVPFSFVYRTVGTPVDPGELSFSISNWAATDIHVHALRLVSILGNLYYTESISHGSKNSLFRSLSVLYFAHTMTKFSKRQILEVLKTTHDVHSTALHIISKCNLNVGNIPDTEIKRLETAIRTLKSKRKAKFEIARRNIHRFEAQNCSWLDSDFHINISMEIGHEKNSFPHSGRPKIDFDQKSDRSERRESSKISAELKHDPVKMIRACRYAAKRSSSRDLYYVLGNILENAEAPSKIRKLLVEPNVSIEKKTAQEALTFLLDNSFSKGVYPNMRLATLSSGADIWPTYNDVRTAKAECRPPKESVSILENRAEVTLQPLLNHTMHRIVTLQTDVIIQYMQDMKISEIEAVMMCS